MIQKYVICQKFLYIPLYIYVVIQNHMKLTGETFFSNMQLLFTSPLSLSGLLMTATSTTAGCSIRALSTSNGPIR